MSANGLRMICSKMFSKKIHFREQLAHFRFSVFDPFLGLKKNLKKVSNPNLNFSSVICTFLNLSQKEKT